LPAQAPAPVETPAAESTPAENPAPQEEKKKEESDLTPSKDELTETNLEQILDTSNPAPTATAASTAASSWDARNATGTPYAGTQQQQSARPAPASGFAASALKATNTGGRSASYQRRVLDQEEAVRMPGNREVERTAVQFGAFNLNGSGDEDVDGDREEPETRAQPPQHSPVAHPRASLPPTSQQAQPSESLPTPKQAPGLPSAPQQASAPGLPSPQGLPAAQNMSQQGSQGSHQYAGQFGRYGQASTQQEQPNTDLKQYDAFSRQVPATQSPYEGYPSQPQNAQHQGAFSSAPSDYSSYYTADQQRNAYQNYYGSQYGQPGSQSQDGPGAQRTFSGYGAPQSDATAQYPQSSGPQSQSRYATAGETQGSGHTTPNPVSQAQHQPGQTSQPQLPQQPQGAAGAYPYGHPYYASPYYSAYMSQQYGGYGQGAYGPYGGKGGMYSQPGQGYGTPYDHASSPAAGTFGQGSLHGRDSALGGLGDYGRTGSAQSSQTPQTFGGSGAFGGVHDAFGRNSSYQGQGQHYGQQGAQQTASDDLKPFGEAKTANGPSPSLSQAARPGSATSGTPSQSVLPPPQSTQQGYGGYPSHLQQQHALHGSQSGSQYGGLGGLGGHQAGAQGHQNSQYGGYQGFGGNYYGGNQQRGGWGGNYGH
jgi:hypothetical protein